MRYDIVLLDLFSGAGGFALGLKKAGFKFKKHYFSEIEKNAIGVYKYQFKEAIYVGKVEEVKKGKIESPDIICFGSPCQDISVASSRGKGLKGSQSSLFFEAIRIIKEMRPSVFIFENVKGIFSSNQGKDFEIILKAIADIGVYECQWQLINTSWFLPQHRERFYLVGHLREEGQPEIFPIVQSDVVSKTKTQGRKKSKNISSALTASYSRGVLGRGETYVSLNGTPILIGGIKNNKIHWGGNYQDYFQGYRIYSLDGLSPTITTSCTKLPIFPSNKKIRRLTPLECERLQGFDDNWTKQGIIDNKKIEISDTKRYMMMGNAVSVPIVKAIGIKLIDTSSTINPLHQLINQAKWLRKKLLLKRPKEH